MEVLFRVCSAIHGLVAVSWLLIRPPRVQEPLFRCELASVHRHCGDASNLSLLHFICFFGGLLVSALGSPCVAVVPVSSTTTAQFPAIATCL